MEQTEKGVQSSESRRDPERTVELEFFGKDRQIFDLDDLLRASAQMMGKGKLGSSYKAILESGSAVVVKRLKEMNGLSKKEFIQKMQLVGNMRHDNLVEILSIYCSNEEKLVVYKYVQGGSLFELLHGILLLFFFYLSPIFLHSLESNKVTTQKATSLAE